MVGMDVAPLPPLTVTETAVALYASGVDLLSDAAVARGVEELGGTDGVREQSRTWLRLNTMLINHGLTIAEYERLMGEYWPDLPRLRRCNDRAFGALAWAA